MASPLTIQPNAAAGEDTYLSLSPSQVDTNFGTNVAVLAGRYASSDITTGLLKFDLSGIPAGATITSAILTTSWTNTYGTPVNMSVFQMRRAWTELGATWNKYDGTNAWGTAGAANTTSDCYATAAATTSITGTGDFSFDITALVSAWFGGTANYGACVKPAATSGYNFGGRFYSSDYTTDANKRPKLVITYTEAATGCPKMTDHYSRLRR